MDRTDSFEQYIIYLIIFNTYYQHAFSAFQHAFNIFQHGQQKYQHALSTRY